MLSQVSNQSTATNQSNETVNFASGDEPYDFINEELDVMIDDEDDIVEEIQEEEVTGSSSSSSSSNDHQQESTAATTATNSAMQRRGVKRRGDTANVLHENSKRRRIEAIEAMKKRKVVVGMVNKQFTVLPKDFAFPNKMSCQLVVRNWFIPNNEKGIVAYRRLESWHCKPFKGVDQTRLQMARFMIHEGC